MTRPDVIEIPADVNFNPQDVGVHESFLRPAARQVDVEDWPVWTNAQTHLPHKRVLASLRCRTHALHLSKETVSGKVESINAIACGDRVCCPRCATAYAFERWSDHWAKLGVICLTSKVAMDVIELRAVVPQWNAAVAVPGCAQAENVGRLCPNTSICGACENARRAHAGAAQIETELAKWVTTTVQELSPFCGGVRHTRIEQPDLFGPIEIVFAVHIPNVAVETFPTATKLAGDLACGKRRFYCTPDFDKLRAGWEALVCGFYQGTLATVNAAFVETPAAIENALNWTHRSSFEIFAKQLVDLGTNAGIPSDTVRTFARAAGLGVDSGSTGRQRRLVRSSWFGCFVGQKQVQTLNALNVRAKVLESPAKTTIVDSYRIVEVTEQTVTVQSTRTAQVKQYPRQMVRLIQTVDRLGRPTMTPRETIWERDDFGRRKAVIETKKRAKALLFNSGFDAGGTGFANKKGQILESARQRDKAKRELRLSMYFAGKKGAS